MNERGRMEGKRGNDQRETGMQGEEVRSGRMCDGRDLDRKRAGEGGERLCRRRIGVIRESDDPR